MIYLSYMSKTKFKYLIILLSVIVLSLIAINLVMANLKKEKQYIIKDITAQTHQLVIQNMPPEIILESKGKYSSITPWPIVVEAVEGSVECLVDPSDASSRIIQMNGYEYCSMASSEGAAGSYYTTYEMIVQSGAHLVSSASVVVKTVQCANFDEPMATECKAEEGKLSRENIENVLISALVKSK